MSLIHKIQAIKSKLRISKSKSIQQTGGPSGSSLEVFTRIMTKVSKTTSISRSSSCLHAWSLREIQSIGYTTGMDVLTASSRRSLSLSLGWMLSIKIMENHQNMIPIDTETITFIQILRSSKKRWLKIIKHLKPKEKLQRSNWLRTETSFPTTLLLGWSRLSSSQ